MEIVNCDLNQFYALMETRKLYCFGGGRYAEACCNVIIDDGYGNHIEAFADNNEKLWGSDFALGNFKRQIISPDELKNRMDKESCVLICCADVAGVYSQLEKMDKLKFTKVFMWQLILSEEYGKGTYDGNFRKSDRILIPKKIHYCWFGGKPLSDNTKRFIENWRVKCPDYEILEWNETNYNYTRNRYMDQAYQHGYFGFVADCARLDIIYHEGGIYLDTDVEIIKNLDELLCQNGFAGINMRRYVNLGGGFGARKELPIIKKLLDYYDDKVFEIDGKLDLTACDLHQYRVLRKLGFKCSNRYQEIESLSIYPTTILEGRNSYFNKMYINTNTFLVHHQNLSWFTEQMRHDMKNRNDFFDMLKSKGII